MASSSSSSRKRSADAIDLDEAEGDVNDGQHNIIFERYSPSYTLAMAKVVVSEREANKFERLTSEAQKDCIRAVSRLFLFKGSKHHVITRKNVADVLNEIDSDYKTHVSVTIERAQQALYELGYLIVPGVNVKHIEQHKKTDTYYLCASVALPSLKNALRLADSSRRRHEYLAFCMVVFHSILATTGSKITCHDLLRNMRKVDPRFPDQLAARGHRSAVAVPELGRDFMQLLADMQKEGYIQMTADDLDKDDEGKQIVQFGPRFFIEVGKQRLLKSYFKLTQQPMDPAMMRELEKEDQELFAEDEEGEGEEKKEG
eukprot:gene36860-44717_t